MSEAGESALVLFSGGQDSTTCLAWALERFDHVETVGFDYGQRHLVELDARPAILEAIRHGFSDWAARLGEDHMLDLGALGRLSDTSLTRDVAFAMEANGLPNSFVPGRNLIFLSFAAALAYRRGLKRIVTGVCETDYSGYPDCRDETMKAMEAALNLGMESRFVIDTPLMRLDKSETWALAQALGGETLVEIVRELSHSCYRGDAVTRHDWGHGCGDCPACALRARGWADFRARTDPAAAP